MMHNKFGPVNKGNSDSQPVKLLEQSAKRETVAEGSRRFCFVKTIYAEEGRWFAAPCMSKICYLQGRGVEAVSGKKQVTTSVGLQRGYRSRLGLPAPGESWSVPACPAALGRLEGPGAGGEWPDHTVH